jgi:catechol 2,3-dioxygenase-like lactoylglutathione lyase family enzyme
MEVQFVASIAPIIRDLDVAQAFYQGALGLSLEGGGGGDYKYTNRLEGTKHFGLWPLAEAATACFGTPEWPDDVPVPQASVEFEVPDVPAAADELKAKGYRLIHDPHTEPWGQITARLLSPEGLLIAVCYSPAFHDDSAHSPLVATSRTESPSMNDEEQVPEARTPAAPADAGETPVEKLEALGFAESSGNLPGMASLIDVRCEMPQCCCFRGRSYFEPRSGRSDWSPTADHYPRLKMHGSHLTPDNVRLAHRVCNQRDYLWRVRINAMLGKRMSLEEIAEKLNVQKVPTIHCANRWTAASVRKAFVS